MIFMAKSEFSEITRKNVELVSDINLVGRNVRTLALRFPRSSTAISPKTSPLSRLAIETTRPSVDTVSIVTSPEIIT